MSKEWIFHAMKKWSVLKNWNIWQTYRGKNMDWTLFVTRACLIMFDTVHFSALSLLLFSCAREGWMCFVCMIHCDESVLVGDDEFEQRMCMICQSNRLWMMKWLRLTAAEGLWKMEHNLRSGRESETAWTRAQLTMLPELLMQEEWELCRESIWRSKKKEYRPDFLPWCKWGERGELSTVQLPDLNNIHYSIIPIQRPYPIILPILAPLFISLSTIL